MKKLLTTILFFTTLLASAQTFEWSDNREEFIEQAGELFSAVQDKKANKEFVERVRQFFNSPNVSDALKRDIVSDCKGLRRLKARTIPNYQTCFDTYFNLAKPGAKINGDNYTVWHSVLEDKFKSKTQALRRVMEFYAFANEYLVDFALKKTPSVRWRPETGNLTFINMNGQLVIEVPTTRITCLSQGDSIEIFDTRGMYYSDEAVYRGDQGMVTWEKLGFPRDQINAKFSEFEVDMTKNSFEVEHTTFINTEYFPAPLYGPLEHKVVGRKSTIAKNYPKFQTANVFREINNIFDNVDYVGGFAQIGSSFQGSGDAENPAKVSIYRNDTLFVEVQSLSFNITKDRIESNSAEISIKLADYEITHPGLLFRYIDSKREMHLIRSGDGLENSAFQDYYHMVSMDVEFIKWKIDEPQMELRMVDGAARGYALFESLAFYREDYYYKIQGMEMTHPFQSIVDFYRYNGGRPFTVEDYALFRMLPQAELRQQIMKFSFDGFLDYDYNTDIVIPKERLTDYLLFRLGKKDYDVIKFESVTDGRVPNGILDLTNYDILLNGVRGVAISEVHNVAFYPEDGKILLKKNRDFQFDGMIDAGMLNFEGARFYFSYNDYRIELKQVAQMNLKVLTKETDAQGRLMMAYVTNSISDLTGYIQIDEPDNKSGNKDNPQYPILTSEQNSFVYYDDKRTQNGAYDREHFFFTVDPFSLEDINHIQLNETSFEGTLTSNIFPEIHQKLQVRDDYSLGFEQMSPPEGYPIYGGRATFTSKVDLSGKGLKGDGHLDYVASHSYSEDFTFLLDQTTGKTYDFNVDKTLSGVTFPGVELGRKQRMISANDELITGVTELKLRPYEDEMKVINTLGKFQMFPNEKTSTGFECELNGNLVVTPQGLRGHGKTDLMHAAIESAIMDFTDHQIIADTTYFMTYKYEDGQEVVQSGGLRKDIIKDYSKEGSRLYSTTSGKCPEKAYKNATYREDAIVDKVCEEDSAIYRQLMRTSMVATIDFENREGYFSYKNKAGNEWVSKAVKYKTWLKHITWDMDRNIQTFGQKDIRECHFVCTKETPDSLKFDASIAVFDAEESLLTCEDVENIFCADANVILAEDTRVVIHTDAVMDPFNDATVELKTDSTYHKIYDSHITIEGAKKYHGIGSYDYVNANDQTYTLFVSDIHTDDGITNASGNFPEDILFNDHFAYKGKATIIAVRQLLEYDGGAKFAHCTPPGPTGYVRFNTVIDPKEVLIPIGEKLLNWNNDQIYCDFFMKKDSSHVYTSMIETRKEYSDIEMLQAQGTLFYNKIFERYEICSDEKRLEPSTPGTDFTYSWEDNITAGTGAIDLGVMMPETKPISLLSAGNITHDRTTNTIHSNTLTELDFFFSDELATMIYNDLMESEDAKQCDTSYYKFEQRLVELYDSLQIKNIAETRTLGVDPVTGFLPAEEPLFLIDNFDLVWNTPKHAWICDTTVNIMLMRNRIVSKKVHLQAEFVSRKTGSTVDLYFTFGDNFYYFGYKTGNLQVISSNKEFNKRLQQIDPKERRSKARGILYTFAPDSRRKRFLTNFGPLSEETETDEDTEDEPAETFDEETETED